MKILCGLGNPGLKYQNTRHNAGFLLVDAYAEAHGFPEFKEKWNALVSEKGQGDDRVLLLKPLTYMNRSGEALLKFVNFYKVEPENIILSYDDVDLPLGELRFREKGSAGTHNGMKSVIACLGTEAFPRLRLGVESRGETAPEQMPLSDFVLAPFSGEERGLFDTELAEGLELLKNRLA